MAQSDILLSAGIKFNPRDIDTKAISSAVVKALSTTRININKVNIGKTARTALEKAVIATNFRIEKAKFNRTGLSALSRQFKQNEFRIDKVAFTNRALSSLNSQLKKTKFEIATAQPSTGTGGGAQGSAGNAVRQQTEALKTFNQVAAEQRAGFLKTNRDLEGLIAGTSRAERAQRNYLQTVAQGSVSLQGFGANIVKITQRFAAYLVSIRAILVAQQAFSASLDFIVEFDGALQNLAKVVDTTETSLSSLAEGLFGVANSTGNAVTAVAEATGQFVRQGLSVPEALERSRAALIGVNSANISVGDSTKLVTVALRVFGNEIGGAVEALDILNSTADNAATNQQQIVGAVLRSGSAAQAVGVSFRELNAIIAATVEQTQLSGNQIGSALKTIFARLATNTSGLREQANALGANIQPGEALVTTLQKLADVFPNLTRDQKAQLVALAAGKRRFTEFSAVLQQFQRNSDGTTRVQELLNEQLDGAGNTAAKNAVELGKLSTRAQQTANAFSEFISVVSELGSGEGISNGIGTLLDSLTSVGSALTTIVKTTKEIDLGFGSLFGVLGNLAKASFFVLAPVVIRGLITGAKTFLGLGQNIATAVNRVASAQIGLNTQLQQGVTIADNEARALNQSTQALREQLQLRQAINNIADRVSNNALNNPANLANQLRSQAGGQDQGRFRTFFRSVDNLRQRAIGGLQSGFRSLENNIGQFGARLAVTTVALQGLETLAPITAKFADDLESAGDVAAAGAVRAGQSAAEAGLQIGLLAGPTAGLIAGVVALTTELTKSTLEIVNNSLASRAAAVEAGKLNVALGQVEKTASEDLLNAFKNLASQADSDNPEERARALVSADVFVIQSLQALASESSTLNSAFKRSGDILSESVNQVSRALRAANLDQVIESAVSQIQRQSTAQEQTGAVGGTQSFNAIRDVNSEIAGLVSGQTEGLLEQEEILTRISSQALARSLLEKTASEQANLQVGTAEELLRRTNTESESLRNLRVERDRITASLEEQTQELQNQLQAAGAGLDTIKSLNNALKQAGETQANAANFATAGRTAIEASVKAEGERARLVKVVEGGLKNVEDSFKEQTKLSSEISKLAAQQSQEFDNIVAKIRTQSTQAQLALQTTEQEVQKLRESNSERARSVESSRALLEQQLNVNTFSERQSVIQTRLGQQQADALRLSQRKLDVDIRSLETARAQANAAGQNGVVQQLDQAIDRARQLREEQSREIRQEFQIKLQAEVQQDAFQTFQRAEQTLRDFRVRQIEDVLRREQDANDRRISFIRQLGETVSGRQFISQQGLSGSPQDERDFGLVTASILRQFEDAGSRTIDILNSKLEQLRVNGSNTFQELRDLKDQEKRLNGEIASLLSNGADPQQIAAARTQLSRVSQELQNITDRGIDNARELTEVTNALGEARTIKEENLQRRRDAALNRVAEAAARANTAEEELITARNAVPASNQRIIQSQRTLAQAEARVTDATRGLSGANQSLADANFELALSIGLAEFRARQAAGGFSSIQQAINTLQTAFEGAVEESRGSFEAILNARREVLQEEVSLVQNQLQSLRSLSQSAFSADPEQLRQLQTATQIGAGVQSGDISSQDLLQLPPELRQSLAGLTSTFPALQQAIDEIGSGLLGIDPAAFQTLESQIVELQTGIAETGQIQVQTAEEGVRTAQQQLVEARESKNLAQQQFENSIAQKEALLANVAASAQNASVARAGFNQQANRSSQLLAQAQRGAESAIKTEIGISKLEARQAEIRDGINAETQNSAEQLGIARLIQPAIEETRTTNRQIVSRATENVAATIALQGSVANIGASTISVLNDISQLLHQASNRVNSGNILSTSSNATGSLTSSEMNGLVRAASMEKRGMPTGSKLMLANTSETVLTKRQAKSFGLSPKAQANAQSGNAVVDGEAFTAIASQLTSLNTQLGQLAARAATPQQVNVNLESARTIQVEGVSNLQTSLQDIITQRLGNTPSQEEIDTINSVVTDIITRMKESGNEDFQNL